MQLPLFHNLQRMTEEDEPGGLGDPFEVVRDKLRTDEPGAWKLKSCTFIEDQSVFVNVDTNEGTTVDIERVGPPGSDGLATPVPAVKKVFVELDSKGGMPPKHALAVVKGTGGLETLGTLTGGVEASDVDRLLAR